MAYDEQLATRLRDVLTGEPGLTEKRMFGGLAFLVDGNLAVSASSKGGLLLRVEPRESEALLDEPSVQPFEMRGREMAGWLWVQKEAVATDAQLERWVGLGVARARAVNAD